jgi:Transcription initiation factor TFIID component TAF4 family
VAKQYNIPRIDNEVIMLLSLTLEHHLRHLISQMCLLARHRTSPLSSHPSNSSSTLSTLLDLARAERQKEELFQSRKRARTAEKEGEAPPEKRVAPSSIKNPTSRSRGRGLSTEMTSEAQKRSTDTTVNVMLGGGRKKRYSWMNTGGGGVASPAPSSPGVVAPSTLSVGTNREDDKLRGRSVERPGWVTLKDALDAIERDGGGEGGVGLGWDAGGKALWRGWARVKD